MLYPFCRPVREIVHPLQLVDYSFVHADRPWYNYKLYHSLFASTGIVHSLYTLGKLPVPGRPRIWMIAGQGLLRLQ